MQLDIEIDLIGTEIIELNAAKWSVLLNLKQNKLVLKKKAERRKMIDAETKEGLKERVKHACMPHQHQSQPKINDCHRQGVWWQK